MRFWFVTAALLVGAVDRLPADALVMTQAMKATTIAEIFIDARGVRVEIEIGAKDLDAFRNLLPDELFEKLTKEAIPLEDRLRTFLKDDWIVRADGRQLEGGIVHVSPAKRVVRDEITGDPLPNQPQNAENVIQIEARYPLTVPPQTVSISPRLKGDAESSIAQIGFVVYHQGVAVNDFRYLTKQVTLRLDWSDPWYSEFSNQAFRRRYFAPAAAFLYVENLEVRKEIVFRPRDLQHWVDLGLDDKRIIKASQRAAICEQAAAFLNQHTPVQIDDRPANGALDRVHFVKRTLRSSGVVDDAADVNLDTALLGAIFVYPISDLPRKVTMGWDLFNERITKIPAAASDEAGGMPSNIEPDDPQLTWINYLTNPTRPAFMTLSPPPQPRRLPVPVISLLCFAGIAAWWIGFLRQDPATRTSPRRSLAISVTLILVALLAASWTPLKVTVPGTGRRIIADEEAADVARGLLHNMYRAFDYRDEGTIYDVL
ncbi:MAG: hypothetical protein N2C14_19165, partial [Planctomycetales bacterium]